MRIVLIGATGLIGSALREKLLSHQKLSELIVITRKKIQSSSNKLTQIILSEFNELDILKLELQADVFISCLGTTIKQAESKENFKKVDFNYVYAFAQLAHQSPQASFFTISSLGASSSSALFYNKIKGELEEKLLELGFYSLYILRPSLLIGNRSKKRFLEEIGIRAYYFTQKFLSPKIQKKLGTKVEDICLWIEAELDHLRPGVHFIDDFYLELK